MRIDIAKLDLEAALSVVGLALGSGTAADLSTHFVFRIKGDKVHVLGTNGRVSAGSPLICTKEGNEGEAFTVEAWRLNKWLSGVPDGVVKLSADGTGDVHASSSRSKTKLRSLDAAKFPYWDGLLARAKTTCKIAPAVLGQALELNKTFTFTDDTSKPELCQIEAKDGVVWATDRRSLSSVLVPSAPTLNIRVPNKDIGPLTKFLSLKQTSEMEVEIQEATRPAAEGGSACSFFLRPDGAYLSIPRPPFEFPKLEVDRAAVADLKIRIDRKELENAFSSLEAGAPKGLDEITFQYDQAEKLLSLSMVCDAGGTDVYPLSQAVVDNPEKFTMSFKVNFSYIKGIASTFGLDEIEFGVKPVNNGGYIFFNHTDETADGLGNQYFSVIVWRT